MADTRWRVVLVALSRLVASLSTQSARGDNLQQRSFSLRGCITWLSVLIASALLGDVLGSGPAVADARAPSRVTAVWSNPQHLDLFVAGNDGRVMSTWWEPNCGWQPWFAIHPQTVSVAPGQPVTAVWSNPQHLDLFVTASDGRIMSTWWEFAKGWQNWFAIHPETAMAEPGQPVTAVWSNPQHLDLFITGKDGRVMSTWWEGAKSWQNWFAIHPESAMAAPGQSVTAVWSNPQHLDLFVTGKDGRVMSTWWEGPKSWQNWFAIHPETSTAAPGQPVTAVWSNPRHLDLFITGKDGRVMSTWWEGAKSWQNWFAIHPESAMAAPGQPVTAVWSNPQHLDLFITGKDGRVMSTWWEGAKSWQPWFVIHTANATAAPGQPVTAVWSNPQHLDLFIANKDGHVMSTWWEGAKSWQNWFAIYPDAQMAQVLDRGNVITQLYDNARTGAHLTETILTPDTVSSPRFGKLYQRQLEGQVLAQPLYIRNVDTVGHGRKNLLLVATAANLVYAFDADDRNSASSGLVFSRKLHPSDLLSAGHHSKADICDETFPHYIGVTSTPVIDPATNIMYVVAYSSPDENHYVHALSLADGLRDVVPPVKIAAPGFDPLSERNRPALLMKNNVVYVAFGSFICDHPQPFAGWVFGYRALDLALVATYRTPVAVNGAGIWQAGRGLVSGADDSIYLMTGNESGPHPSVNLANSFVQLHAACHGQGLTQGASYPVKNTVMLSQGDTDLGSSGPLLLPGGRLVGGGKQGRLYVLDAGSMTLTQNSSESDGFDGFQAFINTHHEDRSKPSCTAPDDAEVVCRDTTMSDSARKSLWQRVMAAIPQGCYMSHTCYQWDQGFGPNIHAGLVYWQGADPRVGFLYGMAEKEYLRAFRYDVATRHVEEKPVMTNTNLQAPDGMPGGALSISANGNRNGIVWLSVHKEDAIFGIHPARLVAADATTLRELWRDDNVPYFAKFNPPTIADGKVFLATFANPDAEHPDGLGWVMVYGLGQ